jgi:hypothetical protein
MLAFASFAVRKGVGKRCLRLRGTATRAASRQAANLIPAAAAQGAEVEDGMERDTKEQLDTGAAAAMATPAQTAA